MKKYILLVLLLFIPQLLVFTAAPAPQAEADHLFQCSDWPCGVELVIKLSDETVTDANITWQRQEDFLITNPLDGFEVNSGTLVFDGSNSSYGNHYHSVGYTYIKHNEDAPLFCDVGAINDIVFTLNGEPNAGIMNLCESFTAGIAEITLTLPEDKITGNVTVTLNDLTGIMSSINPAGLTCSIVSSTATEIFSCVELIDSGQMSFSGMVITIIDLPPGDYTLVISYEETCGITGDAFNCPINNLIDFNSTTGKFTIVEAETTTLTLDIEANYIYGDEPKSQPQAPESDPLPCNPGEFRISIEWLICPVVNLLFLGINTLYSAFILPLLPIDPLNASNNPSSAEASLFLIWNNFRIIANVLLVLVFLAVIIGQSLGGFSSFSAYDIRKIIPRLVIGVIAVQLSWFIVGFLIDIFNVLGAGIRGLILAPVNDFSVALNFDMESNWQEIGLAIGIGGALAAGIWVGGILMGLPLVLFPIILGMILAFITILMRRVLIMLLIVTAPLAFLAWILPNTDTIFKKWWEYFWKALIMYPLIIALLSAGELMASIITASNLAESQTQESVAISLVAMIALFAPYFLIPFTFRFAGSALAEVANGLDKQGKNFNERIFGTSRDQGSWRGRRNRLKAETRSTRKSKILHGANKMEGWGKGGTRSFTPRRLVGRLGAGMSRVGAYTGGGLMDTEAQQLIAARKWVTEMTGSARDEEVYAILGAGISKYNILGGGLLSAEARRGVVHNRKDRFKVQAAFEYAIGKSAELGDDDDLGRVYHRFMHGETGPKREHISYHGNLNEHEKEVALELAADRYQYEMGDLKYLDQNPTTGNLELSRDTSKLKRFALEANARKGSQRSISSQRSTYWKRIGEMGGRAQEIYERVGGDANFNAKNLKPDERVLLRELRYMRESSKTVQVSGGPGTANRARRRMIDSLSWLDHKNLEPLKERDDL